MTELWDDQQQVDVEASFANVFADDPPAAPEDNPEAGTPVEQEAVAATEDVPAAEADADTGETTGAEQASAAEEPTTDSPAAGKILGKFESVDDLIKAYENVEQYSSRMAWERDEALRYVQQAEMRQQERTAEAQALAQTQMQQQAQQIDWDSLIDDKPGVAAQYAKQLGDDYNFQRAMVAWEDVSPGTPQTWMENQKLRDELNQIREQLVPTQQTVEEQRIRDQVAQTYQAITNKYPDFEEFRAEIAEEVGRIAQGGNPHLLNTLQQGSDQQRFAVLENLLMAAKGRKLGEASQIAARAAQIHVEETQRAKAEAQTVSATTTGQADLSPAEQLAEQWKNLRAPLDDGWMVFPDKQ